MPCNQNLNGRTFVNTVIPAPGATATDATYVVDLTHYTCGNRKICANGAYPINSQLSYQVYTQTLAHKLVDVLPQELHHNDKQTYTECHHE